MTARPRSCLTKAERERVAKLIVAARGTDTLTIPAPAPAPAVPDEEFKATLQELHLWWKAASAIAKTAGLKKIELISLGLATRGKSKPKPSKDDEEPEDEN